MIARPATHRADVKPRALRARYDAKKQLVMLELRGGAIVGIPVAAIAELRDADQRDLRTLRIAFDGESLSLSKLDVDISVPGLLRDLVGITAAAAVLGRRGGEAKSAAKSAAVRENGKLGGRPRKKPSSV